MTEEEKKVVERVIVKLNKAIWFDLEDNKDCEPAGYAYKAAIRAVDDLTRLVG